MEEDVVRQISQLLQEVNPFANGYRHLRQVYQEERDQALRGEPLPQVVLEFVNVLDRAYNAPMVNEVATIYRGNEHLPASPNLRIFLRDRPDSFQLVSHENPNVDPLTFPLLLPRGDPGWHFDNRYDGVKVTLCEYYAYRLAYRNRYQVFYRGARLTQQYIVHAYIKIEANRIKYVLFNQNRLRAEEYVGLADYLRHREEAEDDFHVRSRVVLPSSFLGSARSQQQRFQDAMVIVSKYGNPSPFITFTYNPKWPDVLNIPEGDEPSNHPMLVASVSSDAARFHRRHSEQARIRCSCRATLRHRIPKTRFAPRPHPHHSSEGGQTLK